MINLVLVLDITKASSLFLDFGSGMFNGAMVDGRELDVRMDRLG